MGVDIDHLRSNGHFVGRNGHGTHAERQPRQVDYPRLLALGRELLLAIGEDPEREGLRETPRRWADAWREFMEYDPGTTETTFASTSIDQIVCVSGLRVWSVSTTSCPSGVMSPLGTSPTKRSWASRNLRALRTSVPIACNCRSG